VRNALKAQPNVEEVGIDFNAQVAYVVPNGDFDIDAAIAALEANGYGATIQL
jgi:ABC-type xylose transport system substrate-binding protein